MPGRKPKSKTAAKGRKKAPAKKRNRTIIKAGRIDHLDVSRVHNPAAPGRRRNAYTDLIIYGQAAKTAGGWKIGGRTIEQGRGVVPLTKRGYFLDRATGTVYAKRVRNGAGTKIRRTAGKLVSEVGGAVASLGQTIAGKKANPKKRAPKRRRNESGAAARRREFAGEVTGYKDLYFPAGTPEGLSTLGPLLLIRTAAGDIQPTAGGAYLCQDKRGKLYIGATSERPLWTGPAQTFGAVSRVEYECAKPHLNVPETVTWFHDFERPKPELRADGKGGLRFVGGGYTIEREGITG